jgi:hypothetical protein
MAWASAGAGGEARGECQRFGQESLGRDDAVREADARQSSGVELVAEQEEFHRAAGADDASAGARRRPCRRR